MGKMGIGGDEVVGMGWGAENGLEVTPICMRKVIEANSSFLYPFFRSFIETSNHFLLYLFSSSI